LLCISRQKDISGDGTHFGFRKEIYAPYPWLVDRYKKNASTVKTFSSAEPNSPQEISAQVGRPIKSNPLFSYDGHMKLQTFSIVESARKF
jgi:hypothetical protein